MIQTISFDQVNELKKWDEFVQNHPEGSPFYLSGWLRTIYTTYKFKPLLYALKDEQNNYHSIFPCFLVKSILTGSRLVSLPFSDYGGILGDSISENSKLFASIVASSKSTKYVEIRGPFPPANGFLNYDHYKRHVLNLNDDIATIKKNLNKKTILYQIRKAEKNNLIIREENSSLGIEEFYKLNLLTRKKHGVPGQPYQFFQQLYQNIVAQGFGFILLASLDSKVIGASLFLKCGDKIHYKYNVSNPDFIKKVSPNHALTWHAIVKGNEEGYCSLDFGRTSPNNEGLMRYKEMWGMKPRNLIYVYYPEIRGAVSTEESSLLYSKITQVWRSLPEKITSKLGPVVYRHIG